MNKLFARVTAPRAPGFGSSAPVARPDAPATYRMFVRDLVLEASVGVYDREKEKRQRVRVNLEASVLDQGPPPNDRLADVVSYADFVAAVREVVEAGHITLIETLADRIARRCLADDRVRAVRVRVEKLDVFPDATVGIEVERSNG